MTLTPAPAPAPRPRSGGRGRLTGGGPPSAPPTPRRPRVFTKICLFTKIYFYGASIGRAVGRVNSASAPPYIESTVNPAYPL